MFEEKDKKKNEEFGEFVPTYFGWIPLDEQKKSELKQALEIFYDERTIEIKPKLNDFSLKMENWKLILTSHWWYKTKIDLNKKELVWFLDKDKKAITFTNLSDLLNTADLTNKILEVQEWKTPKAMPPFQYKQLYEWGITWRWIYFNDAKTLSFSFDTRVLSWGWRWTIGKFGTLCNYPEEYAEYLSKRWLEIHPQTSQQK